MDSFSTTSCRLIAGLCNIQKQYQGYLIDAWGVLHDGERLYPYVLDCLANLRDFGKKIIILSNAARRCEVIVEELKSLDIQPENYLAVISSGELTWHTIRQALGNDSFFGRSGYYLGPPRSNSLIDGLEIEWVDDIEQAEFILNTGAPIGNPPTTIDSEALLTKAAFKDIPMICANPDQIAIRGGKPGICAGALAKRYSELGGRQIQCHGKPYSPIYSQALTLLDLQASEVLAIGDALDTDIRGGQNVGLDTCLIAAGIHRDQLLPLSTNSVRTLAPVDTLPNYVAEYLAW